MSKFILLAILLIPATLLAQEFQFVEEWDSIGVEIENYMLPVPWTGGYTHSSPNLCDIDGDGDYDLFLGQQSGKIAFFQNNGSPFSPNLDLVSESFILDEGYSHSVPVLCDIDSDGDLDLFADWGDIPMKYYENIGNPYFPEMIIAQDTLRDAIGDPIDGSEFELADINADGDLDLFVGQWYTGVIKYYENTGGSSQYLFTLVDTIFSGINVGSDWNSPTFCDLDADSDFDLFIGEKYGKIWYYRNDGTPQQCNYTYVTNNWLGLDVGDYASPEFCDIDGDCDYDLFVGKDTYYDSGVMGDIFFYENIGSPDSAVFQYVTSNFLSLDVGGGAGASIYDIDLDGDLDFFYCSFYHLGFIENTGTYSLPSFDFVTDDYFGGPISGVTIDFYDLNADSNLELIMAEATIGACDISFYINRGTPQSPNFMLLDTIQTGYILGQVSLADMDDDGDGDLIVPELFGGLLYYQNTGTPQNPSFTYVTNNYCQLNWSVNRNPQLVDMDNDGDFDMLAGRPSNATIEYYKNIGSPTNAILVLSNPDLLEIEGIYSPGPYACDIDGDSDMDGFVCWQFIWWLPFLPQCHRGAAGGYA